MRALLAYKRGEPRVCAMVRAPTPQEEDRRRICRERKTLTAERVEHVNRINGLLFAQGISDYEPLLHKRRERLEELRTGDGRPLPEHLKAQIRRELDQLELTLQQIKSVETERNAMLSLSDDGTPTPAAMLKNFKGIGPELAGVLWSEGLKEPKKRMVPPSLSPRPTQAGYWCGPKKRRPDVSLKRHRKRAGSCKRAQTLDTEQRSEIYHGIRSEHLDPQIPM